MKIRISRSDFHATASALLLYLVLSFGGLLPLSQEGGVKSLSKGLLLCVLLLYPLIGSFFRGSIKRVVLFTSLGLTITLPRIVDSTNIVFAMEQIDGSVFAPACAYLMYVSAVRKTCSNDVLKRFIVVSISFLALTLLYKYRLGFMDRSVRFFMNGPIVFGWICGLSALSSLFLWTKDARSSYLVLSFVFFLGIIWTQSKGPFLAFAAGLLLLLSFDLKRGAKLATLLLLAVFVVWLGFGPEFDQLLAGTRLADISRIFSDEAGGAAYGSIGVRRELMEVAIEEFLESPILGIGLGNFKYHEFQYPHNQHLEVFVSLGLVGGALHLLFVGYAFLRGNAYLKSVIMFFAVASSFSGDISYLRFLYFFCLVALTPGLHGRADSSRVNEVVVARTMSDRTTSGSPEATEMCDSLHRMHRNSAAI